MRMYTPSGDEVLVDKAQIPALEKAGWSLEAPETTDEPDEAVETEAADAGEKKTIPVRRKRPAASKK